MDEARSEALIPTEPQSAVAPQALVETASAEYLGRWHRLVSTTNWEKGRIICQWRHEILSVGAALETASDEAWSRRVGNVSPQHVGRLRRVFQRFGEIYEQFAGLYWSHFLAALDWHDAEMWLEGAALNGWSVARMRDERWRALGALPSELPREDDLVAEEPGEADIPTEDTPADIAGRSIGEVQVPGAAGGEESVAVADPWTPTDEIAPLDIPANETRPRSLQNLPELPPDLADAFEKFQLAILNHKLAGWRDVAADTVLAALDALKELALAPSGSNREES